ncbi:hypothetical protein [Chryseobacterium shigense]|uniref:Uncharacterized protein n=1 Tax=Chryseobacterium shigense TaxID=297244 RepID=A0A841NB60_9FLAO|nr:hypothetical protein [Chryseobacterium shigense]MBB6369242.1 hypothetical protein [Chryseobacterium shigense]
MKIRFKDEKRTISGKLLKDEYRVVAREEDLEGGYTYVFFDENFQDMRVKDIAVEIIDNDMSDMVQRNDLSYGRDLYVNEFLAELLELKRGHIISVQHIRAASKAFRYFEKYNYEIPDHYKNTALNENYKMNLIEGFLMAVNPYIERKFIGGNYFESFEFYKGNAVSEIELKPGETITELDVTGYKMLLKDFIESTLHDTDSNEINSKMFSNTLFGLIDSLFIYDISRIFSYKTFYNNFFVIEHRNEYYYLNQFWWG